MQRKLVKQGGSALTITLPSKWIKQQELKAGEEIELNERGKEIVVSTKKGFSAGKICLDISGYSMGLIIRNITAAYKLGYNEIELKFNNPKISYTPKIGYPHSGKEISTIAFVQMVTGGLLGMDMIEQSKNSCLIKELAEIKDIEFKNILRKVFLLFISMFENTLEYMKENNEDILHPIFNIEDSINKDTNFCFRILNRSDYEDYKKTSTMYCFITQLELIADRNIHLVKAIERKKTKVSKDIVKIYEETAAIYKEFYENYYKFDKKRLVDLYYRSLKNEDKISELLKKGKNVEELQYCFIITKLFSDLVQTQLEISF